MKLFRLRATAPLVRHRVCWFAATARAVFTRATCASLGAQHLTNIA